MVFTSENDRLALRVGALVILLLLLGLIATVLASNVQWRPERTWHAYGTFEEGLAGLKVGSPVRLGGVVLGRVSEIEVDRSVRPREDRGGLRPAGPTTGGFLVAFALDASIVLRSDARIELDRNPFSGLAELDIVSVGGERAAPMPGPLDRSAWRAPLLDEGRALSILPRQPGLVRLLGQKGADDIDRIVQSIPGIRASFMGTEGEVDPVTGESWGPHRPSRLESIENAATPLAKVLQQDWRAWETLIESIRQEWATLQRAFEEEAQGDAGPQHAPHPLARIQQLRGALDDRTGLRAVWNELARAFAAPQSQWGTLRDCLGPIGWQASLIASMGRVIWPEIRHDLLVTKTQFVLVATEFWLLMNKDLLLSILRLLQPFSREDEAAMALILAANRAALTAESLRSTIEVAGASIAEGSSVIDPEVVARLEREVLPVMRRYQRDLTDLMKRLDALALRRR